MFGNSDSEKKFVNYYEQDEAMAFVANSVFSDEHFGSAITEEELACRMQLIDLYKAEIEFTKMVIQNNPDFEAMSEKQKINFIANMLVRLKSYRDADKDNSEGLFPKF